MGFGWFLVGFLVFVGGERLYERRYSRLALRGDREAGWSYKLLHSFYIVVFVATVIEYYTLRRGIRWPLSVLGVILVMAAMTVRLTAIKALGRFWSLEVEIREEHQVVREGIYQHIRHPAFLAMAVEIVAIPLVANSFYTILLAMVTFMPLLFLRWRVEEQALVEKLGEAYIAYQREVGALLPKWSALRKIGERHLGNL